MLGDIPARSVRHEAALVLAAAFQPSLRGGQHMAALPRPAVAAVKYLAIDDDAAANAGTRSNINHMPAASARAMPVFRQGGNIAIVIQYHPGGEPGGNIVPHGEIPDVGHGGSQIDITLVIQDKGGHTYPDPFQILRPDALGFQHAVSRGHQLVGKGRPICLNIRGMFIPAH